MSPRERIVQCFDASSGVASCGSGRGRPSLARMERSDAAMADWVSRGSDPHPCPQLRPTHPGRLGKWVRRCRLRCGPLFPGPGMWFETGPDQDVGKGQGPTCGWAPRGLSVSVRRCVNLGRSLVGLGCSHAIVMRAKSGVLNVALEHWCARPADIWLNTLACLLKLTDFMPPGVSPSGE